jgi:hypothetical protein
MSAAVQLWKRKWDYRQQAIRARIEQKRLDKKPKAKGRPCAENFSNARKREADFVNDLYSRLQNRFPPVTLQKILRTDHVSQFWPFLG